MRVGDASWESSLHLDELVRKIFISGNYDTVHKAIRGGDQRKGKKTAVQMESFNRVAVLK